MPEALVEAAAEHGFALFEVPYELPFIALTEKAFTHLVNEQYAVLRRALAAHERLERIVLSEQGLDGVAGALSGLIGGPALVFDGRGEELASSGAEPHVRRRARRRAARARPCGRAPRVRPGRGARGARAGAAGRARGRAATTARRRRGWWPRRTTGALSEFDRLTLHQAVTIVALELLRRRMADDTERRLAGDVLTALVSGELAGADLARRLEPFGLGDRAGMVVLAPPRQVKARGRGRAGARGARRGRRRRWSPAPGRFSCALIAPPKGGDEELFALAERVRLRVTRDAGAELAAGRGPRRARRRRPAHVPRGALRARGARAGRQRRARGRSRRSTTSAPSSCCSRCRTTRRCGCSATRSSRRSRTARAPTAAS